MDIESMTRLFPSRKVRDTSKRYWLKGLLVGLSARGDVITDYGFGPKGFGAYVYDCNYEVLFYSDFEE